MYYHKTFKIFGSWKENEVAGFVIFSEYVSWKENEVAGFVLF